MGKIWNPAIRWTKKHAVFVCIEDEAGLRGLGECWCFDTAPDALVAFLRTEVVPYFLGTPVEEVSDLSETPIARATLTARHGILASALSGVDIAMWDLRAQHENQSIWKSLSPTGNGTVARRHS